MTTQNAIFKQLSTIKNLPTLPHILLKLMDACNQDSQDLNSVADIVNKDPALSAKIMKLVNSAYFGLPRKVETVSQAVVFVGTSGIKNMAICACVYDAFPKSREKGIFSLKKFWWHSLRCAFLAKHMASQWAVCHPDEAFLSGLLHDIGKAVLWVNFRKTYAAVLEQSGDNSDLLLAGEARMGATHAEVGAWLLDRWQLDPSIADSVRYHHERSDRIAQALVKVQIIHAANLLSHDSESDIHPGMATVHSLFGRDPSECQSLMAQSDQEARDVAHSLGIDVERYDAPAGLPDENDQAMQDRLVGEVQRRSLLIGTLEGFMTADDQSSILKCIADGLNILFDIKRSLFFLIDEKKHALIGYTPDKTGQYVDHHGLAVSTTMHQSQLVRSFVEHRQIDAFTGASTKPLTIIDEQLIRLLGSHGMYCLPLIASQEPIGVLALGIDRDDLSHLLSNANLLSVFIHKGALALQLQKLRQRQLQAIQSTRIDASSDLARRVVHEVNNPLSIIKNYLKVLGMKMAEADIDHDEIRIVNEEITRVGQLLQKLTTFSTPTAPKQEATDINAVLTDLLALTEASLLRKARVQLHTDLAPNLPTIAADSNSLKQVFINLIKNAAEAMANRGGNLTIQTRRLAPALGGKTAARADDAGGYIKIVVKDDGPGIPEAIKEKLFDPYVSTKSGTHAGLGLSVVYNTINACHGIIVCESDPNMGTTFTIELPVK
jgi:putative nucleotidyltransferase with HDIG domain